VARFTPRVRFPLPQPAGHADGADDNQNQPAADAGRRELQPASAAPSQLFRELLATNPDILEGLCEQNIGA